MATTARLARAFSAAGRRFITVDATCVRYSKLGHPSTALKLETVKLDTAALKPTQAFIKMLAAPITPTDLSQISGFEGSAKAAFPRVGGNEGVGIVEAVGSGVQGLKVGDYVVASTPGQGTWSTHVIGDADAWTKLEKKPGTAELPVELAAVSVAAPLTAQLLLKKAGVASGDLLVQNLAFSTVGQAVIQYAAAAGVKTANIMRKRNDWGNSVYHLQGIGATLVVDEQYAASPAFAKLLADLPAAKAGLNGAGGASASSVARALGPNATMVTYGSMSGEPLRLSAGLLTRKQLTFSGFNLASELAGMSKAARDTAVNKAAADVAGGEKAAVKLLVAREPFKDFAAALQRSYSSSERKVVLVF